MDRQKYYDYLENLRESGKTNMWGAGIWLEQEFGLSHKEAGDILTDWIVKKQKGNCDEAR